MSLDDMKIDLLFNQGLSDLLKPEIIRIPQKRGKPFYGYHPYSWLIRPRRKRLVR